MAVPFLFLWSHEGRAKRSATNKLQLEISLKIENYKKQRAQSSFSNKFLVREGACAKGIVSLKVYYCIRLFVFKFALFVYYVYFLLIKWWIYLCLNFVQTCIFFNLLIFLRGKVQCTKRNGLQLFVGTATKRNANRQQIGMFTQRKQEKM